MRRGRTDDSVVLHLKSGKRIKTDILLWANGRTGNTDELGLETLGMKPNQPRADRDQRALPDTRSRTSTPWATWWACPASPARSYDQGRFAASHYLRDPRPTSTGAGHSHGHLHQPRDLARSAGPSASSRPTRCPTRWATRSSRAWPARRSPGRPWGCSSCSSTARRWRCWAFTASAPTPPRSSTSARRSCRSRARTTRSYFINTTFNYPTMAEAYRVAALNGLNRVF